MRMIGLLIVAAGLFGPLEVYSAEVLKAPQTTMRRAELPRCRGMRLCDATGCFPSPACGRRPACPPGNPCYSLYGAYGPYGGTNFWGAYTAAGW
jgi:hypothetical protein